MFENVRIQYLFLFFFAFALYGNTLFHDYVLDDYIVITGNSFTKQGFDGIKEILLLVKSLNSYNYLLSAQNQDSLIELVDFYKISSYFSSINGTDNFQVSAAQLPNTSTIFFMPGVSSIVFDLSAKDIEYDQDIAMLSRSTHLLHL